MSIPAEFPEIPQRELRNDVSRVLREVKSGHSYTITVDGAPVADLVPHRDTRRRVAVPRDEVIAAFRGLSSDYRQWQEDVDRYIDDSLYDPYDRAYRRGEFADKGDE
jgi:prevent-host-death family protein